MAKTIKLVGAGVPEEKVTDMIAEAILQNDMKKHPVGSILFTDQNVNPATYMGFGTWELWGSGMVPIGVDTNNTSINTSGKTIGAATVSIAHTHSTPAISTTVTAASGNTGSTTPGATGGPSTTNTGSTTPGATGAWDGTSGSTTPGATGAASGNTGATTLTTSQIPAHSHAERIFTNWTSFQDMVSVYGGAASTGTTYQGGANGVFNDGYSGKQIMTHEAGGGSSHTHTLNSHTHTSAAHTHSIPSHTHTSAAHTHSLNDHTHTSAAHTHSLNSHTHDVSVSSGTTGAASTTSVSVYQPSIACYMWKRVA